MDKHENNRSARVDPTVVNFLSLYLILLAFFILLMSLSQMEQERIQAALGSLDIAFKSKIETKQSENTTTPTPQRVVGFETFPERVKRQFEAALPIGRFEVHQIGDLIRITVPSDLIFVPGKPHLRATKADLIEGIALSLSQSRAPERYHVALQIGTETTSTTSRGAAGKPSLAMLRAGAFARDLRRRGVAARRIVVGLRAGHAGQLRLTFTPAAPRNVVDFRRVAGW